ncbi:SDR family oxidoreductase [Cytobacillus spongiae]|uniref:SDR family oxidoreductase n=1 Tax=Cytobacillus spongiae TaxID=2901381 RepID=UPI001F268173|nr:SDR family oxidoreductase [Cytobacillus spongiae]UII56594.1 SDR family oxidoreductase [Cytobacillus spongiae]
MKHVLVAGATGYLGRYVVKALKKEGYSVAVLVRNAEKLKRVGNYLDPAIYEDVDEVRIGEITDPESLINICEGVDYVFSSVGITRQKDGLTFQDVDYQGNLNLLREAEKSSVEKFMFIHVFQGDKWEGPITEAKEQFAQELINSSVQHLIIRPTGFFSDLTEILHMAERGRAFLVGDGSKQLNPIHGADLASYCVSVFNKSNQIYDIGGPETYTHRQLVEIAFEVAKKSPKTMRLPAFLFIPILQTLKIVNKHQYGILKLFYNGMTSDVVAPSYGEKWLKDYYLQYEMQNKQ